MTIVHLSRQMNELLLNLNGENLLAKLMLNAAALDEEIRRLDD